MDDLEKRLRRSLGQPLPPAPRTLRGRIDSAHLNQVAKPRPRPLVWSGVATGVAVVALISAVVLATWPPVAGDEPSVVPSSHGPSSTVAASDTPAPSVVRLDSLSVAEFVEQRDAGQLGSNSIAVHGYWTNRLFGHSCSAPDSQPGELEIRCHDGEFGITDQDEPIGTLTVDGRWITAEGPAITPFVEGSSVELLFTLPYIHGQAYPPVPIVVRGHIGDPRAADCRPVARELCRNRLVIDEVVEFEPEAVPTPGITPSPSPFPFDHPPAPPFKKGDCAGDVPYSFVGWGYLRDIGLDVGSSDEVVYMMITAGEVDLGSPAGRQGRRVCYAREWDRGSVVSQELPDQ